MDIKSTYQTTQSQTGGAIDEEESPELADSAFISGLRARFFQQGVPVWPDAGLTTPEAAFADLAAAARVVFLKCENPVLVVPVTGAEGSAEKIVSTYLSELNWPAEPPEIPEYWTGPNKAYRRFEVGRAVDVMLEAYHFGTGGSGGTGWPPKNPNLARPQDPTP